MSGAWASSNDPHDLLLEIYPQSSDRQRDRQTELHVIVKAGVSEVFALIAVFVVQPLSLLSYTSPGKYRWSCVSAAVCVEAYCYNTAWFFY